MEDITDWLRTVCIDEKSVFGAYEFALVGEGDRSHLIDACERQAKRPGGLGVACDWDLLCVGVVAVQGLLKGLQRGLQRAENPKGHVALEAFRFIQQWWSVNAPRKCSREEMVELMALVDLTQLSSAYLREVVKPSGLVSADRLIETYELVLLGVRRPGEIDYYCSCTYRTDPVSHGFIGGSNEECRRHLWQVQRIALFGQGSDQVVAAIVSLHIRTGPKLHHKEFHQWVRVFNVQSEECVATMESIGPDPDNPNHSRCDTDPLDRCPGEFLGASCIAFNSQGQLFVGDQRLKRIQVFDRGGVFVRSFGQRGAGSGQFQGLSGLAFTPDRDLVVADCSNQTVKVLNQDGTLIRAYSGDHIEIPTDVAVGGDGSIYVLDSESGSVRVLSKAGALLRTIGSHGNGPGQFSDVDCIAVGGDGQVFISDRGLSGIQVFNRHGSCVKRIHEGAKAGKGIAADADGRLFVGCCSDSDAYADSEVRMLEPVVLQCV
jgi:hypothetical protein